MPEKNVEHRQSELQSLIDLFRDNIAQYKSASYDEANTRVDFIDKFFELLSWDVRNTQGFSERFREVVREDKVRILGKPKAPDYSFRIAKERMFFVEAKKPSVNIKDDAAPAFQLRRYGYTDKRPLSILTDFEEFAVYDTRIKPHKDDKAGVARVFYCRYDEYLDPKKCRVEGFETNFDYINSVFSRQSILKGSFDRYVESTKNKRGTSEVDTELLALIESWRNDLAVVIAKKNPSIQTFELNLAVQRIIDRIVFLRIAEDRKIEEYGKIARTTRGNDIYAHLCQLFVEADEKYNAGLFKQEKRLSDLAIDDKILKQIIAGLYYPDCPYEFSVLPIEILGNIYEQFLGKSILLTSNHQAKVEEKPEVRKAGGVYYTPQYIVGYIIENTIGERIRGKAPKDVAALKVLDPACGSGSFLVRAYSYLLDYHLEWYTKPEHLKKSLKSDKIYQATENSYKLTIEEKQQILLNNILGVDIDFQAVEVTRLSLYLKLLEDEGMETGSISQHELFIRGKLKLLPNLDNNIQAGNSLIEPDFYRDKDMPLFNEYEMRRINAFDWKKQFPQVFTSRELCSRNSGFDCVIGNPPYVRQETLDNESKAYYQTHYKVYQGTADLYAYFIERGINLLKPGGLYSIIVANKWLRANYGEPLRKWLKQRKIREIVDFGDLPVFGKKVTTYPMILRMENAPAPDNHSFLTCEVKSLDFEKLEEQTQGRMEPVEQKTLDDSGWQLTGVASQNLLKKLMQTGVPLKEYVEGNIYYGIKTGLNEAFVIDEATKRQLIKEDKKSAEIIKPFLAGRDIKRYAPLTPDKYLILFPKGFTNEKGNRPRSGWKWLCENYPAIANHLESFKKRGQTRCDQGDYWWELRACDYYAAFEQPKIVLPDIALRMQATLDNNRLYSGDTTCIIPSSDLFLLAILNSELIHFVFMNLSASIRGGYLRFKQVYFKKLPIIIPMSKTELKLRDRLIALVDQMLAAQSQLRESLHEGTKRTLEQRIEILDTQINTVVYELYGLSDEEIGMIERR